MRAFWRRRSLRLRITMLAVGTLTAGLLVGSTALTALFARSRVHALDAAARTEAETVAQLAASGQVPRPLPAPAGSPVLAQLLGADGTVLAATANASTTLAVVRVDVLPTGSRAVTVRQPVEVSGPLRVLAVLVPSSGRRLTVLAAAPLGDLDATLRALRLTLLGVVPFLLAAVASATWLAVGSALRPVDELVAAASGLSPQRRGPPPQLPALHTGDELARLAAALNRMLARLHESAERERSFVADAAHELRTPLASLTAQLEIGRTHPEPTRVGELLDGLLADVSRLSALVSDLLLLARLDAATPLAAGVVDLTALAGQDGPPVLVAGHEPSLARAVANLRDNAQRHGGGRVEVTVRAGPPWALLTVDDDGAGIPPGDRDRVFDRWYRRDQARSGNGAGLGLAIARAVARSHGGDVTLEDSPLGGVRAVLRLPAAG